MEYQIRKCIEDIGGLDNEAQRRLFLRKVDQVLSEPRHIPSLDEQERILRARKMFFKKMKGMTAGPPFPLATLSSRSATFMIGIGLFQTLLF